MSIFVIGVGAAGNKAVIRATELGVIDPLRRLLINSTERDIPENYKDMSIIIGDDLRGCGKERHLAKQAMAEYLNKNGAIFNKIPADVERVVIVTSTEGGTGSGSVPSLAEYIRDRQKISTSIVAFTGFENDVRGLRNTIEFMKDLDEETTVQIISNKKFLFEANGNHTKAHELANDEFCKRLLVMSGKILEETDQNIDETDLHKLLDAPGLLDITYTDIEDPLKNVDMFDKICSNMVDESKSIDFMPTATRLGVIFNVKDSSRDSIDYSYKIFKSKYGEPYEAYTHVQENKAYKKEFVACIASGIKLPIEAMQKVYEEYVDRTSKISKEKDSFFEAIGSFKEFDDDKMFDMRRRRTAKVDKDTFSTDF